MPHVVVIDTCKPFGSTALVVAHEFKIPTVTCYHNRHYFVELAKRNLFFRNMISFHKRADCTIVQTPDTAELLAAEGVRGVTCIFRGVERMEFNPAWRDHRFRQRLGLTNPSDGLILLYVGSLTKQKNVQLLPNVFGLAARVTKDLKAIVVGAGSEREALQKRVPWVSFKGITTGEHLSRIYANSDIFVFPSVSDQTGNVVLEALASGLAVVAFASGAAKVHITHGVNGLLAAPHDIGSFESLVTTVVSNTRLLAKLRNDAPRAVQSLDWPEVIDGLENVLHRVAG